ncbi:MAG: recombination regulator RecX [Bryobacterales bacterium]|jgi:regulatory protein|nr:recombination regulator RecX [Bryobacterales bacterium]
MTNPPKTPPPLDRSQLLDKALRLLGTHDYARAEIQRRLQARAGDPADVNWVLDKLQEAGFLNDARVAEHKAILARDHRLLGQRRARQELRAKLLAPDAVEAAIQQIYQDTDEAELALQFLQRKSPGLLTGQQLEDPKLLQRAYGRLRRAGFSHAHATQALRRHSQLAASLDDFEGDSPED